ncbi:7252_t:CDS:2, partial [Racocetra fulgida]
MSIKLLSVFSQEIINLLNDSDEYNVIIHVGKGENVKTYYKTALSKQWAKKEGDSSILRQPNVTPKVFEIILNGTITLNDRDIMEVLEILAAADELLLTDLLDFIQDHLIETKSEWLHSYILKVYQATLSHDSCSILQEFILATISSDPELLFKSPDFLKDESYGPCFGDKDLWMQGDFSQPDNLNLDVDANAIRYIYNKKRNSIPKGVKRNDEKRQSPISASAHGDANFEF